RTLQKQELQRHSLSQQASSIRESLSGLSDADQKALDDGKAFEAADHAVQSWQEGIGTIHEGAQALRDSAAYHLANLEPAPAAPEPDILQAAREEYRL